MLIATAFRMKARLHFFFSFMLKLLVPRYQFAITDIEVTSIWIGLAQFRQRQETQRTHTLICVTPVFVLIVLNLSEYAPTRPSQAAIGIVFGLFQWKSSGSFRVVSDTLRMQFSVFVTVGNKPDPTWCCRNSWQSQVALSYVSHSCLILSLAFSCDGGHFLIAEPLRNAALH